VRVVGILSIEDRLSGRSINENHMV
jgi:hypothetical protein